MRGKLHVFYIYSQTFANINFENEIVLGVVNLEQMDESIGGKVIGSNDVSVK